MKSTLLKITNLFLLPVFLSSCMCVFHCILCVSAFFFYVFVNMSVHFFVAGTHLFPLWLRLLMSLKTAKLKVPLLVPEGNWGAFDSLTALISVLDTNSGTDAPGQSLVSLEVCLTDRWQVALWHSVSWLTGWQSRSSSWVDCRDHQGRKINHIYEYWEAIIKWLVKVLQTLIKCREAKRRFMRFFFLS